MNEDSILRAIAKTFDDVHVVEADGNFFFFRGPERMFPFVTLVTNDLYDSVSNLNRSGVFRLNIGVSKKTFRSLFGSSSSPFDLTALDRLMPHPVYAPQNWVCVLNPGDETFRAIRPLLAEAYERA